MNGATTFLWVRHAPTGVTDRLIGRTDLPAQLPPPEQLGPCWDALTAAERVFSSPLIRARQTAAALFPEQRPTVVPDLAEQDFGALENTPAASAFPEGLDAAALAAWAPPGGESFADVCARVGAAVSALSAEHEGKVLAVVAHAGVIRAALVHALAAPPPSGIAFRIDPLSITRITLFGAGGAAVDTVNRRTA